MVTILTSCGSNILMCFFSWYALHIIIFTHVLEGNRSSQCIFKNWWTVECKQQRIEMSWYGGNESCGPGDSASPADTCVVG